MQQIRGYINATAEAYTNTYYYLKLGEPEKAPQRLSDASHTVAPMLAAPDLFLLTRLVEIATWSSWKRFSDYEPIMFRYMTAVVSHKLRERHPLTHLLGGFVMAAAISTSYPALWTCISDRIDQVSDDQGSAGREKTQQIRIKAYFYLVRVLRSNGNIFQGAALPRADTAVHRHRRLTLLLR